MRKEASAPAFCGKLHRPRISIPLALFTALYYLGFSTTAFLAGEGNYSLYVIQMAALIGVVLALYLRCKLSNELLWCLSVWGILHMAGGLIPIPDSWPHEAPLRILYSLWLIPNVLKYDQIVHTFGFGLTTWLCWEMLRNAIHARYGHCLASSAGVVALCGMAGMGFGAINEMVEFFAFLSVPATNVGNYTNTGWDLVFNAIGTSMAACVIYFRGRTRNEATRPAFRFSQARGHLRALRQSRPPTFRRSNEEL